MRAQVVACENCSKADQGIVPTGGVHNGWLNLVIYSAQVGHEEGPVNFIKAPVVVDLCSPACAQAWATKLFETIFGKVEMTTAAPDTTTVNPDSTTTPMEPITVEATTPPEA